MQGFCGWLICFDCLSLLKSFFFFSSATFTVATLIFCCFWFFSRAPMPQLWRKRLVRNNFQSMNTILVWLMWVSDRNLLLWKDRNGLVKLQDWDEWMLKILKDIITEYSYYWNVFQYLVYLLKYATELLKWPLYWILLSHFISCRVIFTSFSCY